MNRPSHPLSCFADSQDVDLDAILGELCALESQCDEAIAEGNAGGLGAAGKRTSAPVMPGLLSAGQTGLGMNLNSHSRSNSDGHRDFMCKTSSGEWAHHPSPGPSGLGTPASPCGGFPRPHAASRGCALVDTAPAFGLVAAVRTDSPDNDSAFSDNVSMLSSESSASSGGSGGSGGSSGQNNACLAPSPTQVRASRIVFCGNPGAQRGAQKGAQKGAQRRDL